MAPRRHHHPGPSAHQSSDLTPEFGKKHVARGLTRAMEAVIKSGSGSYLEMEDGRKFLDFTCGIAVTNLGLHHRSRQVRRVSDELVYAIPQVIVIRKSVVPRPSSAWSSFTDRCVETRRGNPTLTASDPTTSQCSVAYSKPYLELINRMLPLMPHESLDTFFFWNSGAEAVEASIKVARSATGRQNIIAMAGGYHGRTFGTMALTRSKTIYSEGVGPLMVCHCTHNICIALNQ